MRLLSILLTILLYCFPAYAQCPNPRPGCSQWNGDMTVTGGDYSFTGASWFYQSVPDSTTAFQILDADGGAPVFNVDTTNERIGIGTNAPATPLDVVGHITASGSVFTEKVVANIGEGGTLQLLPTDNGISNFGSIVFGGNSGSQMTYDATNNRLKIGSSLATDTLVVVGTALITSNLKTEGGRTTNETIYTTTDNILTTDDLVWGDTDGGSFVLTIHDGSGGQRHTVTNSGGSGNALTLTSDGSDTIDGGASLVLYDGETAIICFNSTDNEWRP